MLGAKDSKQELISKKKISDNVMKVISNYVNLQILAILSLRPSYTRELSRILERDETDISRRLKRLEELGLIRGEWKRIGGKNVKVYTSSTSEIKVVFKHGRIEINVPTVTTASIQPSIEKVYIPNNDLFVGRETELEQLTKYSCPVIFIWGPPGIGKTSLVIEYIKRLGQKPVFWHISQEIDDDTIIASKISLFVESFLNGHVNLSKKDDVNYLIDVIERNNLILVIDDYHLLPHSTKKFIRKIAERLHFSKLIIMSRYRDPRLPYWKGNVCELRVDPMPPEDIKKLITVIAEHRRIRFKEKDLKLITKESRGIPLIVKGIVEFYSRSHSKLEESIRTVLNGYYEGKVFEPIGTRGRQIIELLVAGLGMLSLKTLCSSVEMKRSECRKTINELEELGYISILGENVFLRDILYGATKIIPKDRLRYLTSKIGLTLLYDDSYENRIKGLHLLASNCQYREITNIVARRIRKGEDWISCCINKYLAIITRALDCNISDFYSKAVLSVEYAIMRYLNIEPDMFKLFEVFEKNLPALKKDKALYARVAILYATYLYKTGHFHKADQLMGEARKVMKKLKKTARRPLESTYESAITIKYYLNGELEKALESAQKEAEIELELNKYRNYLIALVHVAFIQTALGLFKESLETIEEILENLSIFDDHFNAIIKDRMMPIKLWSLIGMERIGEAEETAEQMLGEKWLRNYRVLVYLILAVIKYLRKDYKSAVMYLEKAGNTPEKMFMGDELALYYSLAKRLGLNEKNISHQVNSPGFKVIEEMILNSPIASITNVIEEY